MQTVMPDRNLFVELCQCAGGFRYLVSSIPPGGTQKAFQIQCFGCGVAGPWALTHQGAADQWNGMRRRVAK